MKKVFIFLTFVLLLSACKADPVVVVDPLECESNQKLINGVCEDTVVTVEHYDEDLVALFQSFESDLDTKMIGSSKLDIILTPRMQPLEYELKDRRIFYTQFDLINEYYFTSRDTTLTEDIDYVEYLNKIESGYDSYYKTLTDMNHETITFDTPFVDEYIQFAKIDFSFELTDEVLSVASAVDGIYKATVTKDFLQAHIDPYLSHYLDDFANIYVVLDIEFKPLDSEYTVSFSMINDDSDATYTQMEAVLTVKILEIIEHYEIPTT